MGDRQVTTTLGTWLPSNVAGIPLRSIEIGVAVAVVAAVALVVLAIVFSGPPEPSEPPRSQPERRAMSAPPPGYPHSGDPRYLVGSEYYKRSQGAAGLPWFVRQAQGLDPIHDRSDFYPPQ